MATCRNCRGAMGQTDVICANCGYDFRADSPLSSQRPGPRTGFAYSGVAALALVVGQIVAAVGFLVSVIGALILLSQRQWLEALVGGPVAALWCLALLVVFARVQDFK
jgi:hypothetical protein